MIYDDLPITVTINNGDFPSTLNYHVVMAESLFFLAG